MTIMRRKLAEGVITQEEFDVMVQVHSSAVSPKKPAAVGRHTVAPVPAETAPSSSARRAPGTKRASVQQVYATSKPRSSDAAVGKTAPVQRARLASIPPNGAGSAPAPRQGTRVTPAAAAQSSRGLGHPACNGGVGGQARSGHSLPPPTGSEDRPDLATVQAASRAIHRLDELCDVLGYPPARESASPPVTSPGYRLPQQGLARAACSVCLPGIP